MIQPLFALADLGFFLLRLFLGVLIFEHSWRGLVALKTQGRFGFTLWFSPVLGALLGALLVLGAFTQIAAFFGVVLIASSRGARAGLVSSEQMFGLFLVALLSLVFAGGGLWGVDQFFGVVLY